MAIDLRETVSAIRISGDLERIGDLAKNIAKRVLAISGQFQPQKIVAGVQHMSDLVLGAAQGRARRLRPAAGRAPRSTSGARDGEIDALYTSLFRELLTYMMEDPRNIAFCTHLLFCRQEHRAHRRPHHQHRRDGPLPRHRRERRRPSGRRTIARASSRSRPRPEAMASRDPDRRGRGAADAAPALQSRGRGLRGRQRGARRRGRAAPARSSVPDLVLLDWMLPGLSGIELCRRIRAQARDRAPADHHADGARRGGRPRPRPRDRRRRLRRQAVLGARAARPGARPAAPRRSPAHVAHLLAAGDIELDRETRRVRRGGRELHLGPTEFRLLEFLMQSPGRVFSREQLLDGVWGRDVYVDERTVDVHVGRLRKALNRARQPRSDPHRARRRLLLRRDLQGRIAAAGLITPPSRSDTRPRGGPAAPSR